MLRFQLIKKRVNYSHDINSRYFTIKHIPLIFDISKVIDTCTKR